MNAFGKRFAPRSSILRRCHVAAGCVLLAPVTTLAQQAETVEEVVVTGTKRNSTLQDSDVAVTVLDADAIKEARLRDARRIDDLVSTERDSSLFVTPLHPPAAGRARFAFRPSWLAPSGASFQQGSRNVPLERQRVPRSSRPAMSRGA